MIDARASGKESEGDPKNYPIRQESLSLPNAVPRAHLRKQAVVSNRDA